ncbi:endoplasmic reticulum chaperone BiP [Enteropsectra breve]|nr:endoplasmic reticulum chaperone BiP [Enteropsectra breve]
MAATKSKSLGIDLGTTMSCMAGVISGELTVIDNRDGERITPSVVCFDKDGGMPVVGTTAISSASTAPGNFVYEVKRMFGKGFHHTDVQKAIKYWPFKIEEIKTSGASDSKAVDNIGIIVQENGKPRTYEPIQVSAAVLSYLLESSKVRLGSYPRDVVITVPAYFQEGAKKRTMDAASIAFAGKVDENNSPVDIKITLLAEPTAAAIAYGSVMMKNKQVKDDDEERILVFDLGGGTYDVSILDFTYSRDTPVGVVASTDGDNFLGGSDFDNVIIEMAKKKFAEMHPNDENIVNEDEKKKIDLRLRQEAIKCKTSLSSNVKVMFNLSCYRGTKDLTFEITRVQFERAARDLFNRLLEKIKGVLLSSEGVTPIYYDDGKLNTDATKRNNTHARDSLDAIIEKAKATINWVIMVGGSSRIPKVNSILGDFFGDSADRKKVVSPLNPDEAIAYGAGYYANAISKDAEDIGGPNLLLIDQVPLNLNIETFGGVATPLIEARTHIPAKKQQVFSTASDNQTSVEIVITSGNRPMSADNETIGRFSLTGIAAAPRGTAQIEVTFEVDKNNILKVTASDKATGNQQVYVENMTNKLTDKDIERMKNEAMEHAAADAKILETTNAVNNYQNTIYTFMDQVDKMGDKLSGETKDSINKRLDEEESWLKGLKKDSESAMINDRLKTFMEDMGKMFQGGESSTNNPDVTEVN